MSAICNIESTKIVNGSGMMRGASYLEEWDSDLPVMQYGSMAFYSCGYLESFKGNLNSLCQGYNMFYDCSALDTFQVDMPSLIDGKYMFRQCGGMTSFSSSLDNIQNGQQMFLDCSSLTSFSAPYLGLVNGERMFYFCPALEHFSGNLSNLKSGEYMFGSNLEASQCKLSIESVENIADSIQDIRHMNRDEENQWNYYYYNGASQYTGYIAPSYRGVISIYTNNQIDNTRLSNAVSAIQGKGWNVYMNGTLYAATFGSSYYDIIAGSRWLSNASDWRQAIPSNVASEATQVSIIYEDSNYSYLSLGSSRFCRIEPSLIENGARLFTNFSNLYKFYGSLSSLVEGTHMFNYCSSLYNFNDYMSQEVRDKTLVSLVGGYHMFAGCAFYSWSVDLPSLTGAEAMFHNNHNLVSFDADLSNLQMANSMSSAGSIYLGMFYGCTNLTHFRGNLVSLLDGHGMFSGCSLDAASIEHIANTINNLGENTDWVVKTQYWGQCTYDYSRQYFDKVRGRIDIGWNNTGDIGNSLAIIKAKGWNVYLNETQVTDDWMATNYPNATVPDELPSGTLPSNPAYDIVEGSAYIPNANQWDENIGSTIKVTSVQNGIAYYN